MNNTCSPVIRAFIHWAVLGAPQAYSSPPDTSQACGKNQIKLHHSFRLLVFPHVRGQEELPESLGKQRSKAHSCPPGAYSVSDRKTNCDCRRKWHPLGSTRQMEGTKWLGSCLWPRGCTKPWHLRGRVWISPPLAAFPVHAESPRVGGGWAEMGGKGRVDQVPRLHWQNSFRLQANWSLLCCF